LQHGCPTKVLGEAIYDIPGLASQCSLDEFWRNPTPPDLQLYRAYRRVLLYATQVTGDFFTRTGIATAIEGCARLVEPNSRLEQLLERYPTSESPKRRVG
jgi:capsular polysaccharide export protein